MNDKRTVQYLEECAKNPQSVEFKKFTALLRGLAKEHRVKGSHHVFTFEGVVRAINMQPDKKDKKHCKRYQVREALDILEESGIYGKEEHDGK